MILFKKFQVIEDGCLMNNNTGEILFPKEHINGDEYHLIPDGNGKMKYFDCKWLLRKLEEEYEHKRIQASSETEGDYLLNY